MPLMRVPLADDGLLRLHVLTPTAPDELPELMGEAGQNERTMERVVPLEGRRTDESVMQVRGG